ncbi:hypothetical protein L4D09_04330 [Photobacterium makurazakiensis]
MKKILVLSLIPFTQAIAAEPEQIQDMSDPLAVYTQAGIGVTDKGLNLKIGKAYDTGRDNTRAMNIIEVKGFGADSLGLDGSNSVDGIRFRNFGINTDTGLGSQVDLNWDFNANVGTGSYSFIQALPALSAVQLYPLAGIGLTVAETERGYDFPASFGVLGMYSRITLSDNIWLNYNPMWTTQLGGGDYSNSFGWAHEAATNYQLNDRQTVRAFVNWGEVVNNTDLRIEFNHQF